MIKRGHKAIKTSLPLIIAILLILPTHTLGAEDSEHGYKHHNPGIFAGTSDERGGENDGTWGLEYEYRFNRTWGAGVVYEYSDDGHEGDGITVMLANAYLHPYAGWRFGAGLGREKVHGDKATYEWVYRLGAAYDFHVGRFGVAPSVNLDSVDGQNVLVYGVALIYPF